MSHGQSHNGHHDEGTPKGPQTRPHQILWNKFLYESGTNEKSVMYGLGRSFTPKGKFRKLLQLYPACTSLMPADPTRDDFCERLRSELLSYSESFFAYILEDQKLPERSQSEIEGEKQPKKEKKNKGKKSKKNKNKNQQEDEEVVDDQKEEQPVRSKLRRPYRFAINEHIILSGASFFGYASDKGMDSEITEAIDLTLYDCGNRSNGDEKQESYFDCVTSRLYPELYRIAQRCVRLGGKLPQKRGVKESVPENMLALATDRRCQTSVRLLIFNWGVLRQAVKTRRQREGVSFIDYLRKRRASSEAEFNQFNEDKPKLGEVFSHFSYDWVPTDETTADHEDDHHNEQEDDHQEEDEEKEVE